MRCNLYGILVLSIAILVAGPCPASASELYLFPDVYEITQTKECTTNQKAIDELLAAQTEHACEEGMNMPEVNRTIDLNNDGKCEIFLYPAKCQIGTGGGWFQLYELVGDRYRQIGFMGAYSQFVLGESKNGYARIITPSYSGGRTNPILTASVLFFDGKEYVGEPSGGFNRGYYMDRGAEAYKAGNFVEAEIYYLNAYRMKAGTDTPQSSYAGANSRLLDANNLAMTWIKMNKLEAAEKIIYKHLREDEDPKYLAAAFYNLGMINEINKKYWEALRFYTRSDSIISTEQRRSRVESMNKLTRP